MKIAVIGAGALGCLFGGRLSTSRHDVHLLHHRQSYVDRLNDEGLLLVDENDRFTNIPVSATTDAVTLGHADLVIVFVKSHQTEAALAEHSACIGPETHLLSLQNGLRHYERLIEVVGSERAFAGVTYQGAVVEEPGYVRMTSNGVSTFGGTNFDGAHRIAELLEETGFPVELVDNPLPYIWTKQLISLPIKPLAALTQLSNGELVADEELRALMEQVVHEAESVAESRDIDIPLDEPMAEVIQTCEASHSHYSSMLQDIWAERKTEIDDVNGALVEMADAEGVDVPANELLTCLVRGLERSYLDNG